MTRARDLRRPPHVYATQCERTAEEMAMDYTVLHNDYRKRKAAQTGRDFQRCSKSARYEVDGKKLCSFHAGMAALKIIMEEDQ